VALEIDQKKQKGPEKLHRIHSLRIRVNQSVKEQPVNKLE